MFTGDILNNHIPVLSMEDSVEKALGIMNEFKVSHLPIVSSEKYVGLINEHDLLDADNDLMTMLSLEKYFIKASLKEKIHFLQAINFCNLYQSNLVPVVNIEEELVGTISSQSLIQAIGSFSGAQEQGAILVLEMEKNQLSISEISRIVESNDAIILHLNTSENVLNGLLTVTLQLNKKEISTIVATFERYEYTVIFYFGDEKFVNDIQSNYENLMNYLEI